MSTERLVLIGILMIIVFGMTMGMVNSQLERNVERDNIKKGYIQCPYQYNAVGSIKLRWTKTCETKEQL